MKTNTFSSRMMRPHRRVARVLEVAKGYLLATLKHLFIFWFLFVSWWCGAQTTTISFSCTITYPAGVCNSSLNFTWYPVSANGGVLYGGMSDSINPLATKTFGYSETFPSGYQPVGYIMMMGKWPLGSSGTPQIGVNAWFMYPGMNFTIGGCGILLQTNPVTTPPNDGSCGGGDGGGGDGQCPSCGGMPVWSVSEPYINLWLHDEPLGYQPAVGPRISFRLDYKQAEATAGLNIMPFGNSRGVGQRLSNPG